MRSSVAFRLLRWSNRKRIGNHRLRRQTAKLRCVQHTDDLGQAGILFLDRLRTARPVQVLSIVQVLDDRVLRYIAAIRITFVNC